MSRLAATSPEGVMGKSPLDRPGRRSPRRDDRLARAGALPYVRPAMRGSVLLFVSMGLLACHPASDEKPVSNNVPEPSQVGSGSGGMRKHQEIGRAHV